MKRTIRFILITGSLVILGGAALIFFQSERNRDELARYRMELHVKGEKLSGAELGYPRPPESHQSLDQLQAAMDQIGTLKYPPGTLEIMHYVGAGRAQVSWALAQPPLTSPSDVASGSNATTWTEFSAQFEAITNAMQQIREATQTPPRYFFNDPTNFTVQAVGPFVLLRQVAQFLMGDAVVALHAHQLDRARDDLHALTQLAQFNRQDTMLVSQMIRAAISGLGLAVTWEALQAQGWSDGDLAGLQKDWETLDLAAVFEKGLIGERAFAGASFDAIRSADLRNRVTYLDPRENSGRNPLKDYFVEFVLMPLWRVNSDADELFYLQNLQNNLDAYRQLQHGTPWPVVNLQLKSTENKLKALMSNPLKKYQYLFSAIALPNNTRAASTCVRNETQRRLCVAAIAIERYRLRNGRPPRNLSLLVPQFLAAVPIDLMSGLPMRYILNAEGGFTLYSVGEDGHDDGGDPSHTASTNKADLWTGRDAVWPIAVFERQKSE